MIKHILLGFLASVTLTLGASAQNKREIIPRDSITHKYCYQGVSDTLPAMKEELRGKLEKWIKQNYNDKGSKYVKVSVDKDSYVLHDREALPGKARKFVEYDLTIDLKDKRYRYKLTNLQYAAVGMYPLEDKMATDKRSDFEEMDTILRGILASMQAALKSDW